MRDAVLAEEVVLAEDDQAADGVPRGRPAPREPRPVLPINDPLERRYLQVERDERWMDGRRDVAHQDERGRL